MKYALKNITSSITSSIYKNTRPSIDLYIIVRVIIRVIKMRPSGRLAHNIEPPIFTTTPKVPCMWN